MWAVKSGKTNWLDMGLGQTTPGNGIHWGYQGQGHLRLALANPPEYEEEGIRRIEKALHKRFG